MNTASTRLVTRAFALEHLDHEPLASVLDRLIEEDLDLVDRRGVVRLGERELALDGLQVLAQEETTISQVLLQERLSPEQDASVSGTSFCGGVSCLERAPTSPLRYSRSNAKRWTLTLMSSALTSLRLRVVSFWNSSKRFSSASHATASASITNDLVPSLIH